MLLGGIAKTLRDNLGLVKSTVANRPNFKNGIELDGNVLTTTEMTALDGVTAGTVTASKAVVVDSNKKIGSRLIGGLLSSLTADGANFGGSGANAEAIIGSGTITIPAATLAAGDVVRFTAHVEIPTTVSTDTLRLRVRVGGLSGTAIYDSTAIDVANNDYATIRGEITFRTVGAAGTAKAVVNDRLLMGATNAAGATQATALSSLDTTSALTVVVTAVWSTQSANVAKLTQLNSYINA